MTELIKADVFFFVTTVAVVLLAILFAVLMFYLIGIMRNVRDISALAKDEGKNIKEDIAELRANIKREGLRFKHLADFMKKPHKRKKSNK